MNMANLRQDRVPGPTLSRPSVPQSEGPAVNGHAPATRGIALGLRLRTSDSSGQGAGVTWSPEAPAESLAADVLTASGGAPDSPRGAVLTTRFFNLQSALLAARRLRWALEGLAESAGAVVTASMAIHAVNDDLSSSAASALESVAPGLVLLAGSLTDAVQQLPGLSLRPAATGTWRELEWRSPAEPVSLAADEQSVLGLIRALGREDPLANSPASPAPSAPPPATATYQSPAGLGRSVLDDGSQPIWKKPWALVGGGLAVLVVVAVFVIRGMAPAPHPAAAPSDSGAKTAAPVPASTPTALPTAQEKPPAPKPPAKSGKQPRTESRAESRTVPQPPPKTVAQAETPKPPPPSSCNLTEAEISLSLQRAARLMSAGKLTEAQDAYQRLVGCPSAHDKAADGLRLVKQRMGFQGTPNQ